MRSIQVNSLPLKEVIQDIAHAFETNYTENCDEYSLVIPERIGKGSIKGINFDSGLGIIQYNCTFHKALEIQFVVNEIHPLKFLYCIGGTVHHRFGNEDTLHPIEKYQKAIVASMGTNGHVLQFKPNTEVVISSLEIVREQFAKKIACELNTMSDELKNLFKDTTASEAFYHDGFYSLQLADSIQEIEHFEHGDFLRKIFLEGKAYQLLTKQIIDYQDDLKAVDHRSILRQSEVRLIEKAASLLQEELAQSETIEIVAKRVGLNANKLQQGFQHLYHMTVNQFVNHIRLELAKDYLLNTDYSISQIVEELGLTSGSYFSKIFKDKYELTPSKFRTQRIAALKKRNLERLDTIDKDQ
ncbi:MAG: AraC family transcriptional regulator [Pricia sp.]